MRQVLSTLLQILRRFKFRVSILFFSSLSFLSSFLRVSDDAHNVFDARALFVAERKERVYERVYERDAQKRKTFTMREQQLLLFLFHFDDENTEGGFH